MFFIDEFLIERESNLGLPYKYRTNKNKNSVRDISNAVFVRSEADSNRCSSFCRAVPSHSAIRPHLLHFGTANIRLISQFPNFRAILSCFLVIFAFSNSNPTTQNNTSSNINRGKNFLKLAGSGVFSKLFCENK